MPKSWSEYQNEIIGRYKMDFEEALRLYEAMQYSSEESEEFNDANI